MTVLFAVHFCAVLAASMWKWVCLYILVWVEQPCQAVVWCGRRFTAKRWIDRSDVHSHADMMLATNRAIGYYFTPYTILYFVISHPMILQFQHVYARRIRTCEEDAGRKRKWKGALLSKEERKKAKGECVKSLARRPCKPPRQGRPKRLDQAVFVGTSP